MKIQLRFSFLFLFIYVFSNAQSGDAFAQSHQRMADTIRARFNRKAFKSIYEQTTADFKAGIKESDVVSLLEKGLYNTQGTITSVEFFKSEKAFQTYILNFEALKIKLNLSVTSGFEIAYLQFLPYSESKPLKKAEVISDNAMQTAIDSLVDKTVKSYVLSLQNCGLSIGVYANGKTTFFNYGETKRESKQLPGSNSIYEIGSISKTFCGLLLAQAIVDGKLKAEDDIRMYLPGKYPNLKMGDKIICLKHLANHTSGLPRIPDNLESQANYTPENPYKNYTKEMLYDYLKTLKPSVEPGLTCEYSNLGMALLGIILQNVYHSSFEQLVKEKIANPNGMSNTGIQLSTEQLKNFTNGYNANGEDTPHWELGGMQAAGGLRSSAEDMIKYLNYNLLEKDAATQLAHRSTFKERNNIGLAWMISNTKFGNELIWHNGSTFGYTSFCGFIKAKNCSLIILSNSGTNVDYIGIAILNFLQQ